MSRIDLHDRILLIELYFTHQKSIAETFRAYKTIKNSKVPGDPFTPKTLTNLVEKFHETGSVADLHREGRPSKATEDVDRVADSVEEDDGRVSVRGLSCALSIPKSTLHRILKSHLHLRPYRFQIVPILTDAHKMQRVLFSQDMISRIDENPDSLDNFLWTDEAAFHLKGVVSTHYLRIWSADNPHAVVEAAAVSPKVTVWMGMTRNFILKPYFFQGNVNGEKYRVMLTSHVIPQLKHLRKYSRVIYQHDGAPSHTAKETTDLLKQHFSARLLSQHTDWIWPPNSPDLSPLDYFFWGLLKMRVFKNSHSSLEELKMRIEEEISLIDINILRAGIDCIMSKFLHCIAQNGDHFE